MAKKDTFELGGREWPKVNWWKMKGMRSVYLTLWAALITSATNGYDGSLMNGLQAMDAWNEAYGTPKGAVIGLLVSIMYVGGMVAIPIAPYIADTFGRRVGIVIGCVIMTIGAGLVSIGFHIELFIFGRFFLGLGLGVAQECSPLLLSELVHPQHRPQYSTIYNALWYVGSLIGACISLGTENIAGDWSWRVPCLLQALPSISQLTFIWLVPESPRFLISKGRFDEAKQILANVHAQGDLDDEMVNVEFEEIKQTISLETEFKKGEWSQFWKSPGNRHRLIILISIGFFSQWSGNGLISYYLPKILELIDITDGPEQLRINMYLQVVNVISAVGICFYVDYFGRRPLFRTSVIGMLVCYVAMTIGLSQADDGTDDGNEHASRAFLVFMFAYYVLYNLAFSGLLVSYSCEIMPYSLRAKGLTVMFFCVNGSLFFNSYVNPVALDDIGWKYYIVYCAWLAFECVVVFRYYIETKNTPLEEIAKYFDGDQAAVAGADTEKIAELTDHAEDAEETTEVPKEDTTKL